MKNQLLAMVAKGDLIIQQAMDAPSLSTSAFKKSSLRKNKFVNEHQDYSQWPGILSLKISMEPKLNNITQSRTIMLSIHGSETRYALNSDSMNYEGYEVKTLLNTNALLTPEPDSGLCKAGLKLSSSAMAIQ